MAQVAETTLWALWWMLSSLEGHWGILGGPRCPVAAADSSAAAAVLAARACGPAPFQQRAADTARAPGFCGGRRAGR
eukprot:8690-Lingulodinium_polyedra.AAC.1